MKTTVFLIIYSMGTFGSYNSASYNVNQMPDMATCLRVKNIADKDVKELFYTSVKNKCVEVKSGN